MVSGCSSPSTRRRAASASRENPLGLVVLVQVLQQEGEVVHRRKRVRVVRADCPAVLLHRLPLVRLGLGELPLVLQDVTQVV